MFNKTKIIPLDLNFQKTPLVIASYLIPHEFGAVLIESGPGSTVDNLVEQLRLNGYTVQDITDVFLTHIHLDHAGASGWLAQHGARIHVHANGASHMMNPEKLLASATRIYGDKMESLWGNFLPVPENRLSVLSDDETIEIHGIKIFVLDTPGHANHHLTYIYDGVCFSGDVGGVRLYGHPFLRIPMPPPEFHLKKWRISIDKISSQAIKAIAPTHFGIYNDPVWHLQEIRKNLDLVEKWMEENSDSFKDVEELRQVYLNWSSHQDQKIGFLDEEQKGYQLANPVLMSADGIYRYWKKYR